MYEAVVSGGGGSWQVSGQQMSGHVMSTGRHGLWTTATASTCHSDMSLLLAASYKVHKAAGATLHCSS